MTLAEKFHQWLKTEPFSSKERPTLREAQCEQIADNYAIEFMNWSREVDTPENAEKWFGYSDQDMLNEFKKEKGL